MIDLACDDGVLSVRLHGSWRAEYARDFTAIEREIERADVQRLSLDLSKVRVINPATIWLIDHIQWKCVTSRKSFDIVASSRIVDMYYSILPVALAESG